MESGEASSGRGWLYRIIRSKGKKKERIWRYKYDEQEEDLREMAAEILKNLSEYRDLVEDLEGYGISKRWNVINIRKGNSYVKINLRKMTIETNDTEFMEEVYRAINEAAEARKPEPYPWWGDL